MASVELLRILFGLLAVLGLIGIFAIGARKAGLISLAGTVSARRRLSISETLPLDSRRRLLIVRCDGVEHLIILGAQQETIVAQNLPDNAIAMAGPAAPVNNPFKELREAFAKRRADAA